MQQAISLDSFLRDLEFRLGVTFADEQRAFLSDFTSPIISFSSPGTGKTRSAIAGLITAEMYHQIPGRNIYALSFTKMATGELQVRHLKDCQKLRVKQTVNFQTFHSLCLRILEENRELLGISKWNVTEKVPISEIAAALIPRAEEAGIRMMPWQVRPFLDAVRSLNSALVFDRSHVESKYAFKRCKMPYEDFAFLRKFLYLYTKMTERLERGDIPIYCLELLLTHPEVSQKFKEKCRLLLVDEFQDLSLLQLRVISLLSDNVVAIGDIKQQIYAFNGACQEIVEQFKRYFPDARELNLNQSFRCSDEVIDFSKGLISPNRMGEEEFHGLGTHGSVNVIPNIPLASICDNIEKQYRENNNTFPRDVLFLFRNNFSAIPIAEELYKRRVPFRINKYIAANMIPVISDMCKIIELAVHPYQLSNLSALGFLIDEMRDYRNVEASPIYKICAKTGKSIFEVEYQWKNIMNARAAMELLLTVSDMVNQHKPMREIFNAIFPLYNSVSLEKREHYLDMPSSYYIRMVQPLVQKKDYFQFVKDETEKLQVITDSNARRVGIRCYTFHAAKGLEADDVYMLDVDEGIVPSMKQLQDMEAAGCVLEKARELRNERSLLFVAVTRAKSSVMITYTGSPSALLSPVNMFQQYDELYLNHRQDYLDVEAFMEFYSTGL